MIDAEADDKSLPQKIWTDLVLGLHISPSEAWAMTPDEYWMLTNAAQELRNRQEQESSGSVLKDPKWVAMAKRKLNGNN